MSLKMRGSFICQFNSYHHFFGRTHRISDGATKVEGVVSRGRMQNNLQTGLTLLREKFLNLLMNLAHQIPPWSALILVSINDS